jgi:hypothetical protein
MIGQLRKPSPLGLKALIAAAAFGLAFAFSGGGASAQVNCGAASTPQMRAWCYQQSARLYQRQSQQYNNIARQQWRQHERIGQALGHAPIFGDYAKPAWNAPRYIYQYRYGRP